MIQTENLGMKLLIPIVLIAALTGPRTASAAFMQATTFTLTTNSAVEFLISAAGGMVTASSSGAATGTFTAWIACDEDATFGNYISLFGIHSMDIDIADNSLTIPLGVQGGINIGNLDYHMNASGPHVTGTATATGTSNFDPGGTTLHIDSGLLTFAGTGLQGGLFGTGLIDWTVSTATIEIPTGATTTTVLMETTADPEKALITVSMPLFAPTDDFITDPIEIDTTILGLIEATGIKMITVEDPCIDGDIDCNGVVNFQDFISLQVGFGITSGASRSDGDLDGDGDVDFGDFIILQINFGNSSDTLATGEVLGVSAVPEPGALFLLCLGLLGLVPIVRRNIRRVKMSINR